MAEIIHFPGDSNNMNLNDIRDNDFNMKNNANLYLNIMEY